MASATFQVGASTDDARNAAPNGSFNATIVTQHLGINAGIDYWNGFRWLNVTIPQGATINTATLDLFSANASTGTTALAIFYGEADDNCVTFANVAAQKPEGRVRTTASVTKSFTVSAWSGTGFGKELVDVKTLVQEIISRAGWVSGNAMAIVGHDNGSAAATYVAHSTYDSSSVRGAQLAVDWTPSGGGPAYQGAFFQFV